MKVKNKKTKAIATVARPEKCRECKIRPVHYKIGLTGIPLKKGGYCQDCYEAGIRRSLSGGGGQRSYRDRDKQENIRETKFGVDR